MNENEDQKAVLGNMSQGISRSASSAVDFAFHRATNLRGMPAPTRLQEMARPAITRCGT